MSPPPPAEVNDTIRSRRVFGIEPAESAESLDSEHRARRVFG